MVSSPPASISAHPAGLADGATQTHHMRTTRGPTRIAHATSASVVYQDALALVTHASAESLQLTLATSPPSAPAGSSGGRRA